MGVPRRAIPLGLLLAVSTSSAAAHTVGGSRFDAPLPPGLLYAGAGLTVAVTAAWLAASSRTGTDRSPARYLGSIPGRIAGALRRVGRYAFLGVFIAALVAGLLGPRAPADNLATLFVWPVWLKGVLLLSAGIGSPWRVLSPWRTVYRWLVRLEGRELSLLGRYPPWLGEWPAFVGFVGWVGLVENLTAVPRDPTATTLLLAGYAGFMLLGAIAYGEAWLDRADALAVLYRLVGRVAPLRMERTADGGYRVSARPPWRGCTGAVGNRASVGFAVAMVYTVSFDGFASTPEYLALRDLAGLDGGSGLVLFLLGLGAFAAAFTLVVAAVEAAGGGTDLTGAALAVAPTLLPIAVAYELAHNYPFVATGTARLLTLLARQLVAVPATVDPLAWLSLGGFWASQLTVIVVGHVVAVVAGHAVTRSRYPTRRRGVAAHLPLTALMVGYTVLSLWIVSRPVLA